MFDIIPRKSGIIFLSSVLIFWVSSVVGFAPPPSSALRRNPETKLCASPDDDDTFMASLRSRMDEVNDRATKLPIVILDTMLPRQVLKIEVKEDAFIKLVRSLWEEENPCFGMCGMARTNDGLQSILTKGVEVQLSQKPEMNEESGGVRVELTATRRLRIKGEVNTSEEGWTEARVEFLDSIDNEEEERKENGADPMSLARAMVKAREFTSPNMNMENNQSLVERWIELARENERHAGQIDKLLDDLGEIPSAEEPTDRAMWIGALVNPLPSMGVSMEIRPLLLTAKTAEERVEIALTGIQTSIKHMDGSKPMW